MSSVPLKKCPRELKVVILFSAASRCRPAAGRKMLFTFVVQLRLISSPGLRANSCRHMWVVLIVSKAEAGVNAHIRYGALFKKQMEACRHPQKTGYGQQIWLLLAEIFAEFTVSVFWNPQPMKGNHLRMDIGSKQHLNIGCRLQEKNKNLAKATTKKKHFRGVRNITCAQKGIVICSYCPGKWFSSVTQTEEIGTSNNLGWRKRVDR